MRTLLTTALLLSGLALSSATTLAKDNVIHMMTMPTAVRGTDDIESGNITAAILKSERETQSSLTTRRAAAFTNLCIGHAKRGDLATALEYCDQSVDQGRDLWMAYVNRGAVHYLMGNYSNSVSDLERAKALRSTAIEVRGNLARATRSYAAAQGNQNLAQDISK
jgi:tetratricopeptide (TPR) repeat protein